MKTVVCIYEYTKNHYVHTLHSMECKLYLTKAVFKNYMKIAKWTDCNK